jgi:hypothetical protein
MNDSERERRMEVERFVCHENVARFRHLLTTDPNERERKMLISLLAEQQKADTASGTDRNWSSPEGGHSDGSAFFIASMRWGWHRLWLTLPPMADSVADLAIIRQHSPASPSTTAQLCPIGADGRGSPT